MFLVFTDLDGSLLDSANYSFQAARPALERLRATGTPLIPVTSKTRAEVEFLRRALENRDPFIVENGGALFVPVGTLTFPIAGAVRRDGYEVIEFGAPYNQLVHSLKAASRESQCSIAAFSAMSDAEVARKCNLPIEQARLAKIREYDEPFEILDDNRTAPFLEAIERRGLRWTRGGRFHHVMGASDKARAVTVARDLYRQAFGDVTTLGLGDAPNDAGFLQVVDLPVILQSPFAETMKELVPDARVTERPGPAGWSEAVLAIMDEKD
jgi:mannosyl-3-phosphoglycerate phosphatase